MLSTDSVQLCYKLTASNPSTTAGSMLDQGRSWLCRVWEGIRGGHSAQDSRHTEGELRGVQCSKGDIRKGNEVRHRDLEEVRARHCSLLGTLDPLPRQGACCTELIPEDSQAGREGESEPEEGTVRFPSALLGMNSTVLSPPLTSCLLSLPYFLPLNSTQILCMLCHRASWPAKLFQNKSVFCSPHLAPCWGLRRA